MTQENKKNPSILRHSYRNAKIITIILQKYTLELCWSDGLSYLIQLHRNDIILYLLLTPSHLTIYVYICFMYSVFYEETKYDVGGS